MEVTELYDLYISTSGVCTDTRNIKQDCMFFALKGETFNGNSFAATALEQGAKYVIVDNAEVFAKWEGSRVPKMELKPPTYAELRESEIKAAVAARVAEARAAAGIVVEDSEAKISSMVSEDGDEVVEEPAYVEVSAMILVEDVLVAMQQLARYHRLRFKIPVIGLTGTNGKTTTKELISAALSAKYNVVSTIGNLNNHIGVPLTLFNINKETQVAVIEMGASGPGEIATLVKMVCPSFGLITNVGKAHLLGFGSFEGVKKTKGELYDNLVEYKKIAFVNVDNPHLIEMVEQRPTMQLVPYGVANDGAKIIRRDGNPFLTLKIHNPCLLAVCENLNSEIAEQLALASGITKESCEPAEIVINTKLIGDYNADNVLAALCISTYLAVPTMDAIDAIENYTPSNNRSQMTKTERNTLIIDAYNANPTSMRAALENFDKLVFENKILILGDMLELGEGSVEEHVEIVKLAVSLNPKAVYLVGGEFAKGVELMKSLDSCSTNISNVALFADSLLLGNYLQEQNITGATILIKGSRGTKLERVFTAL